jgi:aminopeptidase N
MKRLTISRTLSPRIFISLIPLCALSVFGFKHLHSGTKPSLKVPEAPVIEELHREESFQFSKANYPTKSHPSLNVESYSLKARFDWKTLTLIAQVEINLQLNPDETHLTLDSAVTRVKKVALKGGESLPFSIGPNSLDIDLRSLPSQSYPRQLIIEIQYETQAGGGTVGEEVALDAVIPRKGDPISSRVAYTNSEPQAAIYWLPCHNIPADRAKFSAEFTMPEDETLISNGRLVESSIKEGIRTMRYQTDYTLPTYLMAFAIGEFSSQTRMHQNIPISVVWRTGLEPNAQGLLEMLDHQMSIYEKLLVPYPFEKYSLILLPEFPQSGIEHAGITFQDEAKSTDPDINDDFWLAAHELAHQWFGDLVTVKTWDDLWIKEGMADLLAQESRRIYEDTNQSGRLMGSHHLVTAGDAIRDPDLNPESKYTSGPYARSAWLFTQIRSLIGEQSFWAMMQKLLHEHQFGSIGTEEILHYFETHLERNQLNNVRAALSAKALPRFSLVSKNAEIFKLLLRDPDHAMLVPLTLAWVEKDGHITKEIWFPGQTKTFAFQDPRLLLLDTQDIHPVSEFESDNSKILTEWFSHLIPRNPLHRKLLANLGSHHFHHAASQDGNWDLTPEEFTSLFPELPSESAKYTLIQLGCDTAEANQLVPKMKQKWANVIRKAVEIMPKLGAMKESQDPGFTACESLFQPIPLRDRWDKLESSPTAQDFSPSEILYLSSFPLNPQEAFKTWEPIARHGRTVRLRAMALQTLVRQVEGHLGNSKPSGKMLETWKELFREFLTTTEATEILETAMAGSSAALDFKALSPLVQIIQSPLRLKMRRQGICSAHAILKHSPKQWTKFVAQVKGLGPLPDHLENYFENPKLCH